MIAIEFSDLLFGKLLEINIISLNFFLFSHFFKKKFFLLVIQKIFLILNFGSSLT